MSSFHACSTPRFLSTTNISRTRISRDSSTFYETALGQKAIGLMPNISVELQTEGTKLGETIGRDAMLKVLADHPDLKTALEDAEKSAHPQ